MGKWNNKVIVYYSDGAQWYRDDCGIISIDEYGNLTVTTSQGENIFPKGAFKRVFIKEGPNA